MGNGKARTVVRGWAKSGRVISAGQLGDVRPFAGHLGVEERDASPIFREMRFVRHVVVNPEERRVECSGSGEDGRDCLAKESRPRAVTGGALGRMSLREYYARRRVAALPDVSGKSSFMR